MFRQGSPFGFSGGPFGFAPSVKYNPFADSSLALWLDAGFGLFRERTGASATTPASSNGDPVGTWRDRRGSINGVSPSDASRAVVRPTGVNGRPAVQFDGVNDVLSFAGLVAAFKNVPRIYVAAAIAPTSEPSNAAVLNISIAASENARATLLVNQSAAAGRVALAGRRLDADTAQFVTVPSVFSNAEPFLLAAEFLYASGDAVLSKNGSAIASSTSFQTDGSTQNTDSQVVLIGSSAANGSANLFDGMICGLGIWTPSTAYSSAEWLARQRYIARTEGVAF